MLETSVHNKISAGPGSLIPALTGPRKKAGPAICAGTRPLSLSVAGMPIPSPVFKSHSVSFVKAGAESPPSFTCTRVPCRPPVIIPVVVPVILVGAPPSTASATPTASTAASITTHIKSSFNKYDYGI